MNIIYNAEETKAILEVSNIHKNIKPVVVDDSEVGDEELLALGRYSDITETLLVDKDSVSTLYDQALYTCVKDAVFPYIKTTITKINKYKIPLKLKNKEIYNFVKNMKDYYKEKYGKDKKPEFVICELNNKYFIHSDISMEITSTMDISRHPLIYVLHTLNHSELNTFNQEVLKINQIYKKFTNMDDIIPIKFGIELLEELKVNKNNITSYLDVTNETWSLDKPDHDNYLIIRVPARDFFKVTKTTNNHIYIYDNEDDTYTICITINDDKAKTKTYQYTAITFLQ